MYLKITLFLATIIFVSCSALAQEASLEFKGDPLGMTFSSFKEKHPNYYCSGIAPVIKPVRGESTCVPDFPGDTLKFGYQPPTFAGVPTLTIVTSHGFPGIVYRFLDTSCNKDLEKICEEGVPQASVWSIESAQLWSVELALPSTSYNSLLASMKQKYGEPSTISAELLQNLYGVTIEGQTSVWETSLWRVTLVQMFGYKDVTRIVYRVKSLESVYLNRLKEIEKRNIDDM